MAHFKVQYQHVHPHDIVVQHTRQLEDLVSDVNKHAVYILRELRSMVEEKLEMQFFYKFLKHQDKGEVLMLVSQHQVPVTCYCPLTSASWMAEMLKHIETLGHWVKEGDV